MHYRSLQTQKLWDERNRIEAIRARREQAKLAFQGLFQTMFCVAIVVVTFCAYMSYESWIPALGSGIGSFDFANWFATFIDENQRRFQFRVF